MIDSFEKHLALNQFRMKAEDIDEIEDMLDLCQAFAEKFDPYTPKKSGNIPKSNGISAYDMTPDELMEVWTAKVLDGHRYSHTPPSIAPNQIGMGGQQYSSGSAPWQNVGGAYGSSPIPAVSSGGAQGGGQAVGPAMTVIGGIGVHAIGGGGAGGGGGGTFNISQPKIEELKFSKELNVLDRWKITTGWNNKTSAIETTKNAICNGLFEELRNKDLIEFNSYEKPDTQSTVVTGTIKVVKP